MSRSLRTLALALFSLSQLTGCATQSAARGAFDQAPTAMVGPQAAAPLERSLFARDPGGQLSEDALQKILGAPWEIALPARVGVVPILPARDWHGPAPSAIAPAGATPLTRALRGGDFTLVTEMISIPSGALGMEALRELAARYRLRYLVLYREELEARRYSNGWAALYATIVGSFFVPGETLRVGGYVEASLFDCKTGLLLATVRRPVFAERKSNVWGVGEKLSSIEAKLVTAEAPALAADLRAATTQLAEAARHEAEQRRMIAQGAQGASVLSREP